MYPQLRTAGSQPGTDQTEGIDPNLIPPAFNPNSQQPIHPGYHSIPPQSQAVFPSNNQQISNEEHNSLMSSSLGVDSGTATTYKRRSNPDTKKRIVSALFGLAAIVLIIIATIPDYNVLATGTGEEDDTHYECRVRSIVETEENINIHYNYRHYCLDINDEIEMDDMDFPWDTNTDEWCNTWISALVWIGTLSFCGLFLCFGVCWVQPVLAMKRCCCKKSCPTIFFVMALILAVCGNWVWMANDNICLDEEVLELEIGHSINFVWGVTAATFVSILFAR